MKIQNRKFSKMAFILVVAVFSLIAISAFLFRQTPWNAPASAESKKNPLTSDATVIAAGKVIYAKECQSCHGKKGKGDGPSAAQLDIPVGDMTSSATQKQSDGALYWKISEGRKPMPSFKKKLEEDKIWQEVTYIRTLK